VTLDQFVEEAEASLGEVSFRDRFLSSGWFLMLLWFFVISIPGLGTIIIVMSSFARSINIILFVLTGICTYAFFSWTVIYHKSKSPLAKRAFTQRLIRFMRNVFSGDQEIDIRGGIVETTLVDGHRLTIKYSRDVGAGLPMMVLGGPASIKTRSAGATGPRDFCITITGETLISCRENYTFDFSGRGGDDFGKGVRLIDWQRRELPCKTGECRQVMERLIAVVKLFPIKGEVCIKARKFKLRVYDPLAKDKFFDAEPEIRLSRKVQNVWIQKGWEVADIPFAGAMELLEIVIGSRDPASLKDASTRTPVR